MKINCHLQSMQIIVLNYFTLGQTIKITFECFWYILYFNLTSKQCIDLQIAALIFIL